MEKRQVEDVLSDALIWLLRGAEEGRLSCPDCWTPVKGEFVDLPGFFVGLLLYCDECEFVDAFSAPVHTYRRSWEEEDRVPARVG